MILILLLLLECLIALMIYTCILYKSLFTNLFNLVTGVVLLAFIPNFITSLSLAAGHINFFESQVLFGVTGTIVLIALWVILKDEKC